jgi:hypothetical protein
MTIKKNLNGTELTVTIVGRLDTTTAPELETALKESFESANKYDLGQCMVEFRKCMQTEDACGKDWEHCVSIVADLNMQNNETKSTVGTKKAEDTKRIVELEGLIDKAKREVETIQKRIRNERQLNRQMELNGEARGIKKQIAQWQNELQELKQ